jgi:hypothetical protein
MQVALFYDDLQSSVIHGQPFAVYMLSNGTGGVRARAGCIIRSELFGKKDADEYRQDVQ